MQFIYRTSRYNNEIEKVELVKRTAHFVTIRLANTSYTPREAAKGSVHQFHATFGEARQFLIDRSAERVKRLTDELAEEMKAFAKIKELTE